MMLKIDITYIQYVKYEILACHENKNVLIGFQYYAISYKIWYLTAYNSILFIAMIIHLFLHIMTFICLFIDF